MPASFAQHHGSIPLGRAALVLAAALVALGGMPPELFADDRIEYVGTYNPNFFAELQDVELANGRAYIFGVGGFGIMNIDDPAAPTLIGRYEPPGHPYVRYYRGAVGAKYAYGGGREDQVAIIDMTVESNPTNVTTYGDRHMSYEGLELDGDILYACRHNGGLELIDVSMPFAPVTLSELTSLINSWDLALSGSYAFVADGVGGLAVVDIGDSNSPQHLYSLPTSGSAVDVDLDGNLALVACGSAGVEIFDIGDPLNAFWVGNYNSSGLAITLDATGGKAFVADWDDIEVIDLSVPESPSRLAWENTPVRAMGLAAAGDRVYVADWSRFKIYDFGDTFLGDIDLSTTGINFGVVPVGETADTTFSVINTGGGTLTIENIESFNSHFVVVPPLSFALAAGESRDVPVEFTPVEAGYDATFLAISTDDADESYLTLQLSTDSNPDVLSVGEEAPDFTLFDLDGVAHTLSDYLGKVVVLAFFANW